MINNAPALPEGVTLEELLDTLRHLSWSAADILLAYARGETPPYGFSRDLDIEDLGDGPVTAADLAVNQWLLDGLKNKFPLVDWKYLSEESAKNSGTNSLPYNSDWLWIIDPLDGTKDFLAGNGEYAVHIALVYKHSSILGIVLVPESEELWMGIVGVGAWCEKRNRQRIPVDFSKRVIEKELVLVASRNHRSEKLKQLLSEISIGPIKSTGSVGCKVVQILKGNCDWYVSLSGKTAPKDWDIAAPEALLSSAGGSFTNVDESALKYNRGDYLQSGCLIASHGKIHSKLCSKALLELNKLNKTPD